MSTIAQTEEEARQEVREPPISIQFQYLTPPQRLKSALWYHIGKLVDAETLRHNINATPQFIGALTELVWAQIESAAVDLESFARHAGRGIVVVEDVLLLARRNADLEDLLKAGVRGS